MLSNKFLEEPIITTKNNQVVVCDGELSATTYTNKLFHFSPPRFDLESHQDTQIHAEDDHEQLKDLFAATEALRTELISTLQSPTNHHYLKEWSVPTILSRIAHGSNLIEKEGTSLNNTGGL